MTAVATPPSFQPILRPGWNTSDGGQGGLNSMSADEVSRMFMPRKSAQRSNSSSSLASNASSASTSTITAQPQPNGISGSENNGWGQGTRKKPARGLWPTGKAEPIAGISNARPQSIAASSGPSAASAMSAIHQPSSILPSQHMLQSQSQQNGARANSAQGQLEGPAILNLSPINGTFERKTITVPFFPEVLRIGRQTNAKTVPTPVNGYFDSKVLSRQHAEIWADRSGKIWIRDVKSSNGTFVNGTRLSAENKDSEPHELREQDILELGIDIVSEDQRTVVHHKVAARVEHAGIYPGAQSVLDLNFVDIDPTSGSGLMASPMNQDMRQMRGRAGSAGSAAGNSRMGSAPPSVAGNNINVMGQQRHMNFWLTPVTMEQIVKRLMTELKSAKRQSEDLNRTGSYFDTMLIEGVDVNEAKLQAEPMRRQINGLQLASKTDSKPWFSEPPAPPPQQPLPEKPDAARTNTSDAPAIASLQRVDTERVEAPAEDAASKSDQSSQIVSLVEALASARKDIDSQGARVKELEELLQQERLARESAEERAQRLEKEQEMKNLENIGSGSVDQQPDIVPEVYTNGAPIAPVSIEKSIVSDDAGANASAARLQEKLELLVAEMTEMRNVVEKYRLRAEAAEEETASTRKTLAEMVEQIRQKDAERASSMERRKSRTGDLAIQTELRSEKDVDSTPIVSNSGVVVSANIPNGKPISAAEMAELERAVSTALAHPRSRHEQIMNSAPYASIVGVVFIGVGLMAFLNGWQKIER